MYARPGEASAGKRVSSQASGVGIPTPATRVHACTYTINEIKILILRNNFQITKNTKTV